jgi:rsbT co-antagonist protein RsbR
MQYLLRLLPAPNDDEELQRRGFLAAVISLGMTTLALLLAINSAVQSGVTFNFVVLVICVLLYASCVALASMGRVNLAANILVWFTTATIILIMQLSLSPTLVFFLTIALLLCGAVLPSSRIPWLLALCALAVFIRMANTPDLEVGNYISPIFFVLMAAVLAYLSAWSIERSLRTANNARAAAEQAGRELTKANRSLEERVTERTLKLEAALTEVESRATQQADLLSELDQQREAIRELSVPVLPVSDDTLVMPLVGALDSDRLQQVQERALAALEQYKARRLLLDITGVPIVDSQVALGLLNVVQSAQLLGAKVTLVGIRPEVAQAIVGLGLDLSKIGTDSDVRQALRRI